MEMYTLAEDANAIACCFPRLTQRVALFTQERANPWVLIIHSTGRLYRELRSEIQLDSCETVITKFGRRESSQIKSLISTKILFSHKFERENSYLNRNEQ